MPKTPRAADSSVELVEPTETSEQVPIGDVAAVYADVDSLVEWSANPRKNERAILKVAKSIKRFGFGAPIVARLANREIIKGHTRFRAAKALGLKRVPVRFMDISEEEGHKLAIADNKLGEISEWDDEKLEDMVLELSIEEAQLLGFEMRELEKFAEDPQELKRVTIDQTFEVVVKCASEEEQLRVLGWCQENDIECRALI
jgi:ParB family chromosome partitioning protein